MPPDQVLQSICGLWLCGHCVKKVSVSTQDLESVEGLCQHLTIVATHHHNYQVLQPGVLHFRARIEEFCHPQFFYGSMNWDVR